MPKIILGTFAIPVSLSNALRKLLPSMIFSGSSLVPKHLSPRRKGELAICRLITLRHFPCLFFA